MVKVKKIEIKTLVSSDQKGAITRELKIKFKQLILIIINTYFIFVKILFGILLKNMYFKFIKK